MLACLLSLQNGTYMYIPVDVNSPFSARAYGVEPVKQASLDMNKSAINK